MTEPEANTPEPTDTGPPDEGLAPHPADLDGAVTDSAVKPDGSPVKAATSTPASPTAEELAEYDAETVRIIGEAEALARAADSEFEDLKGAAALAKKRAEAKVDELRAIIRERAEKRGNPPEKTLLDFAKPAAKWRAEPLDAIAIHRDVRKLLDGAGVVTLGDLHDQVASQWDAASGPPCGLTMNEAADLREAIRRIFDAEFNATEEAGKYAADELTELWREYPIDRWARFGVTAKDIEKMAAGEVKRETGRRPIVTVGDLSKFSELTGTGYSRGYADIKGIGPGGADRISEAETQFWKWWNQGGGLEEFAREKGVSDAGITRARSGDSAAGGAGGADIEPFSPADDHAGPGDAEFHEGETGPLDSEETAGTFGGTNQPPGW